MKTMVKHILTASAILWLGAGGALAQPYKVIKSFGSCTNISGVHPLAELVQGPDGTLYGTASEGQGSVAGAVFKLRPDGTGFTVLKWFTNSIEGATPSTGLVLDGNTLYGTTWGGGGWGRGTVFKVNTDGTGYTVLKSFIGSDGANPPATLVLNGGKLYGTTEYGGGSDKGTVFKVNTDGTGYTVIRSFASSVEGNRPWAGLVLSGGTLYGTTAYGGTSDNGTVFKVNADGTGYTVLKRFTGSDGSVPDSALVLSGSQLYGTTYRGGASGYGTLFKVNTDGTGYTVLRSFAGSDGVRPYANLILSGDTLYGTTSNGGGSSSGTVYKVNTDGTGFTVLKILGSTAGRYPYSGLVLNGPTLYGTAQNGGYSDYGTVFKVNTNGTDFSVLKTFSNSVESPRAGLVSKGDVLYGTTYFGGNLGADRLHNWGVGTVFKVNTDGTGYTILRNFNSSDGANPQASLILSGSTLYGTTHNGGSVPQGTVFKLNTDGTTFSVLQNFDYANGAWPDAALVLSGSTLYGTTWGGGGSGQGVVFRVNTDGTGFTLLKWFTNSVEGGSLSAGLVLDGSTLYGTTYYGGSSDFGTVFKLNTNGTGYAVLKSFTGSDGAHPEEGLVLNSGTLYGTTGWGGGLNKGVVFKVSTNGTGYMVLKSFTGSDGAWPRGTLLLDGSTLLGTTEYGGGSDKGTVFKVNTDGTGYTVLKSFAGSDGAWPYAGLLLKHSTLYGTTSTGGAWDCGTAFSLYVSGIGPTNRPPVADAGTNQVAECAGGLTAVLLDGTGSHDPDDDPLAYEWHEGGAILGTNALQPASLALGVHLITLHVTDPYNLSAWASNVVIVVDTTPPAILCASNKVLECGTAWAFDHPVAFDNCSGTNLVISVVSTVTNAECGGTFAATRTWAAVDDSTNTATCRQTVTVVDTTPPTLVCPAPLTVEFQDTNGAAVSYAVTASDGCSSISTAVTPASGSLFPIGITPVQAQAVDACGNSNQCAFNVTVLGARGVKSNVLAALIALRTSATLDESFAEKFDSAILHLQNSLKPAYWIDETHLQPGGGNTALNEEKLAVNKLGVIMDSKECPVDPTLLKGLVNRILQSDRLLAIIANQEAASAGLKPKKIAEDLDQVAKGDQEAIAERYANAIEHYRNAWRHAIQLRLQVSQTAGGGTLVRFIGNNTKAYLIEVSTDLVKWGSLGTCTANADGDVEFTDPNTVTQQVRFYRVQER